MDSCGEFLRSIPDVIWAAIIGVVGVIVGAAIAWIGVCLQLRHDSKQKEKERQMALRQDVYLCAAKEIGKLLEYLANFYDTSEPSPKEYTPAIEQIYVIGTDETVKAAAELNDHLVQAFYELIPERQGIDMLGQKLQSLHELQQARLREIDKSIEEMKEYNLQGNVDTQKWAVIQAQYELADQQLQETLNDLREGLNRQLKLIGELAGRCMQRTQRAEELLTPLIVAIRKELDTPFDEEGYKRMLKLSHEKWKVNVGKYVSSMRNKFEEVMKA